MVPVRREFDCVRQDLIPRQTEADGITLEDHRQLWTDVHVPGKVFLPGRRLTFGKNRDQNTLRREGGDLELELPGFELSQFQQIIDRR